MKRFMFISIVLSSILSACVSVAPAMAQEECVPLVAITSDLANSGYQLSSEVPTLTDFAVPQVTKLAQGMPKSDTSPVLLTADHATTVEFPGAPHNFAIFARNECVLAVILMRSGDLGHLIGEVRRSST